MIASGSVPVKRPLPEPATLPFACSEGAPRMGPKSDSFSVAQRPAFCLGLAPPPYPALAPQALA